MAQRDDDDEGSDLPEDATSDVRTQEEGTTEYGAAYGSSASAGAPRSVFIERLWTMQWSGRGKQVDAADDVLANYHDSVLYAPVTFSTKTRALLRGGWLHFQRNLVSCSWLFSPKIWLKVMWLGLSTKLGTAGFLKPCNLCHGLAPNREPLNVRWTQHRAFPRILIAIL